VSGVWSSDFGGMLLSAPDDAQELLAIVLRFLFRISFLDPSNLRPQAYMAGGHPDGWVRRHDLDHCFIVSLVPFLAAVMPSFAESLPPFADPLGMAVILMDGSGSSA
jgi:hypothetical protein